MQQNSMREQNHQPIFNFVAIFFGLVGIFCHGVSFVAQADPTVLQTFARSQVPFELYNGNLLMVKATIGNLTSVNVILDTGTNTSVISKKIANQLKLVGTSETLQTLTGSVHADSVIVPTVEFGVLRADSIRVIVQGLGQIERNLGISLGGIVGLDVVSARNLTIDYQIKKIVFGSMPADDNVVPFATAAPLLSVDAIIDGRPARLLLDSGSCGLVVFRNRLQVRKARINLDRAASISGVGGSTRIRWFRVVVTIGNDRLGSVTLRSPMWIST